MELFEATWREKYEFYERVYDTVQQKSIVRQIDSTYEWFEERDKAPYGSILDDNIRLEKKMGLSRGNYEKYGLTDPMNINIRENYWQDSRFNLDPRIFYLDIETRVGTCSKGFPVPDKAAEPISKIQIFDNKEQCVLLLGVKEWKHEKDYDLPYPVKNIVFKNEYDLINGFLTIFNKLDPLFIYAWNGDQFDFPYLYNRLKNIGFDTNRLSNYGKVKYSEELVKGRLQFRFSADGHFYYDLMKIYKKFVFEPRQSYALDYISELEIGEKKVEHTEYPTFDKFYLGEYEIPLNPTEEQKQTKIYQEAINNNWDEVHELGHSEFCYYSYKDPLLIYKIDKRKNFTNILLMIAEKMGIQAGNALGTVTPWTNFLTNRSRIDNLVMPPKQDHDQPDVVGGFVRVPSVGLKRWVLSGDVNSMYPLLGMCGFNMSPETYVDIHNVPSDLRDIIIKYFNDQNEEARFDIPDDVWKETTRLLNKYNFSLGINGAIFRKDKLGMIPELVKEIYGTRKKAKKTMFEYEKAKIRIKTIIDQKRDTGEQLSNSLKDPLLYKENELNEMSFTDLNFLYEEASNLENLYDTRQLVEKVIINSLYGAMANKYFPLFNEKMAAAITGNGRFFIQMLARNIESTLQSLLPYDDEYVIYGDTDSVYFSVEPFVNKYKESRPNESLEHYVDWVDSFEQKVIQPIIQSTIDDFAKRLNAYDKESIGAEREIIADAAVFTAKKKYYARVRDSEGVRFPIDNPKIKVMGLEIAKSSTPTWCKNKLKEAIPHIFDKDENDLKQWIKSIKSEFIQCDPNMIAQHGKASNLDYKIGDKGIPIGSRAAIVYNNYLKENGLDNKYITIQPDEKSKRMFLTMPNQFNSNVISYVNESFVDVIRDCIDYDENFEKGFMSPLELMVGTLGYNLKQETARFEDDDW